jgi:plastocyanin
LVLLIVLALVAAPLVAFANHPGDEIKVGIRQGDGSQQNEYDDFDKTVFAGTPVQFDFNNGFHNVVWVAGNPEALANSPGAPGGDVVGSTITRTPTAAGTYLYFCSIHASSADATSEDWANANSIGRTSKMVGRIIVAADTTAPVWGAGAATATPTSASQINLTWPAATDDSGSVSYAIYEAAGTTQPAKPATPADTVATLSTSRTGLTAGATYWYWITAVDGSGNAATPDLQANATTSSVAASATASGVVQFSVNPSLSIQVSPPTLDLGTLNPAVPGTGSATVSVQSNDVWSLSVKSIGRDGVDNAGDDAFFTDDSANTIPIARASWDTGAASTPLSDADAMIVTGQAPSANTDIVVNYSVQLQFDDPAGTNYQTVVLYTATQP